MTTTPANSLSFNGADYTLLIVDDNVVNLKVIVNYLGTYGFEIVTAGDGGTAIERASSARPDLILLDVMMPGIDGFETCRRLKADEQTSDIPVIFMTALDSTEDKIRGFASGGVDYITKPFQQEEVLARVSTHLSIRDLTRQLQDLNKNLEKLVQQRTEELHQAYRTLERLDQTKADFIEVAAHELRTPLTLIKGYAQLLDDGIRQQPDLKVLVDGILSGQTRLQEVVDSMLDVSRIDNQTLDVISQPTNLAAVLGGVRTTFETALQERNLQLDISGLSGLPFIEGDSDLLFKVFYHLIMNAIKYTPDGGSIKVTGQLIQDDGQSAIEVVISDAGIGIDPQHHQLIFEKFYQTGQVSLHSSSRTRFKGGGPGLGLAIARGIVLAHNGRIWVESPGYSEEACPGSNFHVVLPSK